MIDNLFRLLGEMDSFKRIALFSLTGLTCLCLLLGYRLIQSDLIFTVWENEPAILDVRYPCYTQQIRDDLYILAIDFPVPDDVIDLVQKNTTAYRLPKNPDVKTFYKLCRSLQDMILDPEAEEWLIPLVDPDKQN